MKKMMYFDPDDVRAADKLAVEEYGIPSLTLMENAGRNAADEIIKAYPYCEKILILAGNGNNGGDGFVAARHILLAGKTVFIITSSGTDKYKGDAQHNLKLLLCADYPKLTIKTSESLSDDEISELADNSDLITDAVLGTGTSGAPRKEAGRLINLCRNRGPVVSLDIPSGINPRTGLVYSPCMKADMTVTFLAPKTGMLFSPAREMCGRIVVGDIGIKTDSVLGSKNYVTGYDKTDLPSILPAIESNIHKGKRGAVMIFGGSWNYRGAPVLAALGALRSGAGLVVLAVPDYIADSASTIIPEAVFVPLKTIDGCISPDYFKDAISEWIPKCKSVVFGPGIGRNPTMKQITAWFWKNCANPMLFDADALYFIADMHNDLEKRQDVVITPHSGEAAAILKITPDEVNWERLLSCRALTKKTGAAVLKGRDTIITASDGMSRVATEGSPALAVPGSGDVLSGSIGAFLASGLSVFDAATAGVIAHAAAGSKLGEKHGLRGTLARDIADELPFILKQ